MTPKAPVFSKSFPPVRQGSTGLAAAEYHIEHNGHGPTVMLRNSAVIRASRGPAGLDLGTPTTVSEISGEPGYVVRTQWATLALAADEICRLFLHDLNVTEFFTLARRHGVFFDISGEFYDELTGKALAPIHSTPEERLQVAKVLGAEWPNNPPPAANMFKPPAPEGTPEVGSGQVLRRLGRWQEHPRAADAQPEETHLGRIMPMQPPRLSEKYPPRGQAATGCAASFITIADNRGAGSYIIHQVAERAYEGSGLLHLHDPVARSELSGEPGYNVELQFVRLALSLEELCRLVLKRLTPEEFFKLAKRYGVFELISSKFYDENTGRALSREGKAPENDVAVDARPHVLVIEQDGERCIHGITTLSQAQELLATFEGAGYQCWVVELMPAPGSGPLEPLGNVVTLYSDDNGEMTAYGRFPDLKTAWAFRPAGAPAGVDHRNLVTAVIHSTIVEPRKSRRKTKASSRK